MKLKFSPMMDSRGYATSKMYAREVQWDDVLRVIPGGHADLNQALHKGVVGYKSVPPDCTDDLFLPRRRPMISSQERSIRRTLGRSLSPPRPVAGIHAQDR